MGRRLTEMDSCSGQFFAKPNRIGRAKLCASINGLFVILLVSLSTISSQAYALGFGAAKTKSYIGEPLSLQIPLLDLIDPEAVRVGFEFSQDQAIGQVDVQIGFDKSTSNWFIQLNSDSAVNEPYIRFKLNVVDNGIEVNRDFTVLLNLSTQESSQNVIDTPTPVAENPNPAPSISASSQGLAKDQLGESIMGPYDTAQAGRIPDKFGAVLDGQSLWRVARRINKAMGVSRSQMMWALYRANPEAFLDRTVSSLKAGSYLTIPDESFVRATTDRQARANLAELSQKINQSISSDTALLDTSIEEVSDDKGLYTESQNIDAQNIDDQVIFPETVDASPFQVTGIDEAGEQVSGLNDADQSQQIISSLSETVNNLSQQLVLQDQKIEFMEKQVVELKSFINKTGSQLTSNEPASNTNELPTSVTSASNSSDLGQESKSLAAETYVASDDASIYSSLRSELRETSLWVWLLLITVILLVLFYAARERILNLLDSLNLRGKNEKIEFETIAAYQAKQGYRENRSQLQQVKSQKDYSNLTVVDKNITADDILSSVAYPDSVDDEPLEPNLNWDFGSEEMSETAEDLSFNERFESLLAEQDFEFARELLDLARYNEINEERYHCERLHLFEKMKDEDGFYDYYYRIESQIPNFPQNLQTQISMLVVQLAQRSSA